MCSLFIPTQVDQVCCLFTAAAQGSRSGDVEGSRQVQTTALSPTALICGTLDSRSVSLVPCWGALWCSLKEEGGGGKRYFIHLSWTSRDFKCAVHSSLTFKITRFTSALCTNTPLPAAPSEHFNIQRQSRGHLSCFHTSKCGTTGAFLMKTLQMVVLPGTTASLMEAIYCIWQINSQDGRIFRVHQWGRLPTFTMSPKDV